MKVWSTGETKGGREVKKGIIEVGGGGEEKTVKL